MDEKFRDPDKKAVFITVPVKVLYNLDQMQKVTFEVLEELGCPRCHSGFDLRFDFERNFRFTENLQRNR